MSAVEGPSGTAPLLPASSDRVDILVVDDTPGQRLAVETVLAELGENIVAVDSGREALRYLLDHDVAVILLDVNMPEMDGFETAALIRQRPRSRNVPIIFLTAGAAGSGPPDRKSTRLNSSHLGISYAVFCLKKKKKNKTNSKDENTTYHTVNTCI